MKTWLLIGGLCCGLLSGCSTYNPLTLMPTPIIYQNTGIDPFAHLREELRSADMQVFYATNRTRSSNAFGNDLDTELHLGVAQVHLGEPQTEWAELKQLSLAGVTDRVVPLSLQSEQLQASLSIPRSDGTDSSSAVITPAQQVFLDGINAELAHSADKEIMVYVHGAKVGFDNAAVLTAEIDHFAGRDFVGVAFSWPSHQEITSYLIGVDVAHALDSAHALQLLLELLAENTHAQRINVLCYSAGGRVVSKTLHDMRAQYGGLDRAALQQRFRIGSVVFAAADVSVDRFLERLSNVSAISEHVVITVSDADSALIAAKHYMGGSDRAGSEAAKQAEVEFIQEKHLRNVEIIDVSMKHDARGFDIVGHHYWYRHPWASSDIVFLMRTDLPASQRGLSASEIEGVWYLSPDYPQNVKAAIEAALGEQWLMPAIEAVAPAKQESR